MKKTKRLSLLILSFLCACHPVPLSHNEQQGINEILRLYGGSCKYSATKTFSSAGSHLTFKIELSNSSAIDRLSDMPDVASSNVAYTFFENLGNERRVYQNIEVTLLSSGGESHTYSYSTGVLALFQRKMKVVDHVIRQIKEKNFDSLKLLLTDTSDIKYDKNVLVANLRRVDSTTDQVLVLNYKLNP